MSNGRVADVEMGLNLSQLPKISTKTPDRNLTASLRKSMHLQPPQLTSSYELGHRIMNVSKITSNP